jgi:hypothetical protein
VFFRVVDPAANFAYVFFHFIISFLKVFDRRRDMPTGGESLHLFPLHGQSEISLSFWRFPPVSAAKRSWELPVRQILDTLYFALTDAEAGDLGGDRWLRP